MTHYVYVLYSQKDYGLYTGYTTNLRRRIAEHNEGKSVATRPRRPLKMVYYEASLSWRDARAREKYLKSGIGKRYLKNRLADYLESL